MSAEIQTHAEQRQQLADVLFDLMRDRIDRHLEKSNVDGDAIRDAIKDMVRDGELSVDVDYSNVELELSISV